MRPSARTEPLKAADICRHFELSEDARELLEPEDEADYYLSVLVENELFTDAIRFAAYRLSKRESIWWGCLCAWEVCRPKPKEVEAAALRACTVWVKEPGEQHRRAAQAIAEPALGTPAGNLALAVFLSGGSIAPDNCPPVASPPAVTGRLVSEAILLASRLVPHEKSAAQQKRFLGIAAEIVAGRLSTQPAARTDQ
ncbi:MAG: hypothetical protein AB7K24_04140 [Gemmataceae bacterium]